MRAVRPLMLLILIIVIVSPAAAQEDEKWYYGWIRDTGQLFAYTAEGEVRVLLEEGIAEITIDRINEQHAFGVLMMTGEENQSFYFLTPNEARLLTPSFDPQVLEDGEAHGGWLTFTDDYAVLPYEPGKNALADFNDGTVELLTESLTIDDFEADTRFSEDGQLLRYITLDSYDSAGSPSWSLRERTLATGEERVIYTGEGDTRVVGDEFGEHWLVELPPPNDESQPRSFLLLDTAGNSEIVAESTTDNAIHVALFEDYLLTAPTDCIENCTATLTPIAGGSERTFISPDMRPNSTVFPRTFIDEASLLVFGADYYYYLLSEEQEPVLIGAGINEFEPLDRILSPDRRFLAVDLVGEAEGLWGMGFCQ